MAGYRGPSSVFDVNPYDPLRERRMKMAHYDGQENAKSDNPGYMSYSPAATAPRSSSIRDNRDRTNAEIEMLFKNVADLHEVLSPILLDEPNEKRGSEPSMPANSSLGSQLQEIASSINRANEQLTELRHRIDL